MGNFRFATNEVDEQLFNAVKKLNKNSNADCKLMYEQLNILTLLN